MTHQQRHILRFALCFLLILTSWHPNNSRSGRRESTFHEKDLKCAISLGSNLKESRKYGLHYDMLQNFADDSFCNISFSEITDTTDYVDSLKQGVYDIVAIRIGRDSLDLDGLLASWSYDDSHAFLMAGNRHDEMRDMNRWLACLKANGDLEDMVKMFGTGYNLRKKAAEGVIVKRVSPYDSIIKKYARELGWDWRMLAALIYQESKFTINNVSPRGAIGLMQVKPSTAARYGIDNLLDPEENIKAGTIYIKKIQDKYFGQGFTLEDKECFTLAAYNAGVGRISDCRKLTEHLGKNSYSWDEVRATMPQMRDDELLDTTDVVSHGHFNGAETMAYVDSVKELYEAYCTICPN